MIDRSIAPEIQPIKEIQLPETISEVLANGMPLHVISSGQQEVAKVEVVFYAGRKQEHKRAVASATASLLKEGTASHTALEIANLIDYYGASIQTKSYIDYSSVTLYCLTKHLNILLPLVYELITEASYPQQELELYIRNQKQKLEVNEMKVEFIAQRAFTANLFGPEHFIGYTTSKSDLEQLTSDDLLQFRSTYYSPSQAFIIASGKLTDEHLKYIDKYLGMSFNQGTKPQVEKVEVSGTAPALIVEEKADAVQSAVRVGKRFINKMHPDYPLVKATNLILGEYFGSRLMSNLREDKGFCYGVYSSIASFLDDAYLCIATEVGIDVTAAALHEIEVELNRLQNYLVSKEELEAAINYRMGVFLSDNDGAFNQHEMLKGLLLFGADKNYLTNYIHTLRHATAKDIREMACKYFDFNSMHKIIAGKM